jgi:hypothetical protein
LVVIPFPGCTITLSILATVPQARSASGSFPIYLGKEKGSMKESCRTPIINIKRFQLPVSELYKLQAQHYYQLVSPSTGVLTGTRRRKIKEKTFILVYVAE